MHMMLAADMQSWQGVQQMRHACCGVVMPGGGVVVDEDVQEAGCSTALQGAAAHVVAEVLAVAADGDACDAGHQYVVLVGCRGLPLRGPHLMGCTRMLVRYRHKDPCKQIALCDTERQVCCCDMTAV